MPGSGCEHQCLERDQQDRAGQLTGTREGKPFQTVHLLLASLHITSESLLQLVRYWRRIEGWHWIHDTLPMRAFTVTGGNGAGTMAKLRIAGLKLLRLVDFRRSEPVCRRSVMHGIKALLAMARRQPAPLL